MTVRCYKRQTHTNNIEKNEIIYIVPEGHPDVQPLCVLAQCVPWNVNFNKHDVRICNCWLQKYGRGTIKIGTDGILSSFYFQG